MRNVNIFSDFTIKGAPKILIALTARAVIKIMFVPYMPLGVTKEVLRNFTVLKERFAFVDYTTFFDAFDNEKSHDTHGSF